LEWAKSLGTSLKQNGESFGNPVKMGPFYLLYGSSMPAVLMELGFLSNSGERDFLVDVKRRRTLLEQLAQTIKQKLTAKQKEPT
jgi:N-acetylmuramoyl-L-alanine amidase